MRSKVNIKIGGEFEINPESLKGFLDFKPDASSFLFSSGRSALQAILKFTKNKPSFIYLPYYICSSVVSACKNEGYKIIFYELDDNFLFPINDIANIKKNSALLTVNYFGFVNDNPLIKRIKRQRPDITIISDQVQSFWTYKDTLADFAFTSLRKHFAIPDGALVHSNRKDWKPEKQIKENGFYWAKLLASFLKNEKVDDNIYLKFFEEGERLLDEERSITKGSGYAQFLLSVAELNLIKEQRLRNTKKVYELGNKIGLDFVFQYAENIVPLVVPILVKNRDEVRKKLFNKNIFLPVHWPLEAFNSISARTREITNSELSLVIDQRYSEEEMNYQIRNLS